MRSRPQNETILRLKEAYAEELKVRYDAGPKQDRAVVSFPDGARVVVGRDGVVIADSRQGLTTGDSITFGPGGELLGVSRAADDAKLLPKYEAEVWPSGSGWTWQTYRDGEKKISRPTTMGNLFKIAPSRDAALEQARLDAEYDRRYVRIPIDLDSKEAPEESAYVVIRPRTGVDVARVKAWLEDNFQVPGSVDEFPSQIPSIRGGNPLVDARIEVVEEREDPACS